MKRKVSALTVLLVIVSASVCFAAPTFTNLSTANIGANMATLIMQSTENGTGYFTILTGSSPDCGTSVQVKAGKTATDAAAPYFGSLPLTAVTDGFYTVRNLTQSTAYTTCYTADSASGTADVVSLEFSTSAIATLTFPGWQSVGSAGFSVGYAHFTTLAIAPDGTPYTASVDANDGYTISVSSYDGNMWNPAGNLGSVTGSANPVSLAFAPDGALHLSFVDATYTTQVMQYDGVDTWSNVGTGLPADTDVTSLAFAPDGTPYVAYIDGVDSRATVMKYSAGVWINTGVSTAAAWSTSLAIAKNGTPTVAYSDYDKGGKATVMQYNGTNWLPVASPGFTTGTATNGSLAIAPDGTLYLAYQDGATSGKATVMKFSGGTWSLVGDAGFSAGTATNISLAIAPDGKPAVAYQDGANSSKATVLQYTGSAWIVISSAGFSTATASSPSLAFAPDGSPAVAFSDEGYGSRATVMKLTDLPPTISGTPTATGTVGVAYSFTPTYTYATSFSHTDNLPPGLDVDPYTGVLSGIPTTVGTYSGIVITATNSVGSTPLPAFSITVTEATATGSVKIGSTLYLTISAALGAATGGDTLKILASIPNEGINFNGNNVITLAGGYAAEWNSRYGFSPVSSLTITGGTLIIDQIEVQ